MHRFAQRLFGDRPPRTTYLTDGSARGKLLVADRLGLTLLPDYSLVDDPLTTAGIVTHRPLSAEAATISLALLQRRTRRSPESVAELRRALVQRARVYQARSVGDDATPAR
jgi:DNA-binding transcriptional LysR family regulator